MGNDSGGALTQIAVAAAPDRFASMVLTSCDAFSHVLLALTGSSCSGKTTIADRCVDIDGVVVHESDELGVPGSADLRWRQRTTEEWVQRTLAYEHRGCRCC